MRQKKCMIKKRFSYGVIMDRLKSISQKGIIYLRLSILTAALTLFSFYNTLWADLPDNYEPFWKYEDIITLDGWGDLDDDARDAIAVYVKEDDSFFHFRVDLMDLRSDSNIDLYFAIDYKEGGNQELVSGNTNFTSDIEWDLLMVMKDPDNNKKVFDTNYTPLDYLNNFIYESELDYVAFSIPKNVMADGEGNPLNVQVIVTADNGTTISDKIPKDITDAPETGRAKLVLVFGNMFIGYGPHAISWYDGYAIRENESGREGERRGIKYLLDAIEKYKIPLTTWDLRLEILPCLEYLEINDRLREMAGNGLLEIVDTLSYGYFMPWQPGDVDAKVIAMAKKFRQAMNLPHSKVFFPYEAMLRVSDLETIKNAGYEAIFGFDRYRYWLDGWDIDWGDADEVRARIESGKKIHKVNDVEVFFDTRIGNYRGIAWDPRWGNDFDNSPSDYEMYLGTDNGLHLFWRRILLDMALDSDQEKFFTIGSDILETPMVFENVAELNAHWLAEHPWIEVVTFSDLLNKGWEPTDHPDMQGLQPEEPLERYPRPDDNHYNAYFWQFYKGGDSNGHSPLIPAGEKIEGYFDYIPYLRDGNGITSGRKMGDDETSGTIVYETLQNLRHAPDNNLTKLAWLSYLTSIQEQTLHSTSATSGGNLGGQYLHPKSKLRANYLGHVNKIVEAAKWVEDVKNGEQTGDSQVISKDLDLDGESEYILKNDRVFTVFENDGGRMEYAFAYDPVAGAVQMVGPTYQFYGSIETGWNYTDGEVALRPNQRISGLFYDAAFVEQPYQYNIYAVEIVDNEKSLKFTSPSNVIIKTITLEGNTVAAAYQTTLEQSNAATIGFGLPVDMLNMFSPSWDEKILRMENDNSKGWRIRDGACALVKISGTSWFNNPNSFTDSPAKEEGFQRENYEGIFGHQFLLPYNVLTVSGFDDFTISLTLSGTADACEPETRDPVDIVLVLDISGSMGDPAKPGGRAKIEVLKEAVELFLTTWSGFATSDDRVEIVYFSSDVSPVLSDFSLQNLDGNVDNLITEIKGKAPGGCTAMGGGLRVALEGLHSTSDKSHPAVLLFTNGIQNRNPMVVKEEDNYEIKESSEAWCGTSNIPGTPVTNLSSNEIPIHIIGIGEVEGTPYQATLDGIRGNTGLFHVTQDPDEHLREFYLNQLVEVLNLKTLEMVDYRHNTLQNRSSMSETFVMDGAITKAAFLVHWVGDSFPEIIIDGPHNANLQPTEWIKGKFYRIAYFDFPHVLNGLKINPVGTWRISTEISGKTIPYQAALLVDETDVHYNFNFSQKRYWTGDPIIITARVTESGRTIKDLTSVMAELTYPETPLGTLLSTKPGTASDTKTDLHSTRGYSKLLKLLENPIIRRLLEPRTTTLDLYDDGKIENGDFRKGDGIYSAKVETIKTKIPGVYKFDFEVEGETLTGWPIKRTQVRTTMVRVKPDEDKTRKTARWIKKPQNPQDRSGTALITVIPYDKFENYLGPDYGNAVQFSTTYGNLEEDIYDALDGSYEFKLHLPDRSQDPTIDLSVFGFDVYKGPLSNLFQVTEHYGVSAHLGYTFPASDLNIVYDSDISWGVDLEFLLNHYLSLEALFGHHTLKSDILDTRTYWMNLSCNLKWFLNTRRIRPFINGGAGFYKTDDNPTFYFGFNVGGGIAVQLWPTIYIESAYNYHRVLMKGDNIIFSTAQLGLRLRF